MRGLCVGVGLEDLEVLRSALHLSYDMRRRGGMFAEQS